MIQKALQVLFSENRIFSSEADFQFAFAWQIKKEFTNADVRLEYTPWRFNKDMHIDIVVFIDGQMIPIELKYKTKGFSGKHNSDEIYLKNHGAQDISRYNFLYDIERMESITECGLYPIKSAYAILLTSDPSYWKIPKNNTRVTIDEEFRIHEGSVITGKRDWKSWTSAGTKKNCENPIMIHGTYHMMWNDYIPNQECPFKYTIVEIKSKNIEDF